MPKKQTAQDGPSTPGPIRAGSTTHRLMELVATAVAAKLAAGGNAPDNKSAGDGRHAKSKRSRGTGGTDGH